MSPVSPGLRERAFPAFLSGGGLSGWVQLSPPTRGRPRPISGGGRRLALVSFSPWAPATYTAQHCDPVGLQCPPAAQAAPRHPHLTRTHTGGSCLGAGAPRHPGAPRLGCHLPLHAANSPLWPLKSTGTTLGGGGGPEFQPLTESFAIVLSPPPGRCVTRSGGGRLPHPCATPHPHCFPASHLRGGDTPRTGSRRPGPFPATRPWAACGRRRSGEDGALCLKIP